MRLELRLELCLMRIGSEGEALPSEVELRLEHHLSQAGTSTGAACSDQGRRPVTVMLTLVKDPLP